VRDAACIGVVVRLGRGPRSALFLRAFGCIQRFRPGSDFCRGVWHSRLMALMPLFLAVAACLVADPKVALWVATAYLVMLAVRRR
jgi:hypothetical protein